MFLILSLAANFNLNRCTQLFLKARSSRVVTTDTEKTFSKDKLQQKTQKAPVFINEELGFLDFIYTKGFKMTQEIANSGWKSHLETCSHHRCSDSYPISRDLSSRKRIGSSNLDTSTNLPIGLSASCTEKESNRFDPKKDEHLNPNPLKIDPTTIYEGCLRELFVNEDRLEGFLKRTRFSEPLTSTDIKLLEKVLKELDEDILCVQEHVCVRRMVIAELFHKLNLI